MPILVPDRPRSSGPLGADDLTVQEDEAARLGRAEGSGKPLFFWYLAVSVLWVLGTDVLIDRFGSPAFVVLCVDAVAWPVQQGVWITEVRSGGIRDRH